MSESKLKEIITNGTLNQFQGLIEFEQLRSKDPDYYYISNVLALKIYGPIKKESSMYWLVTNGGHMILDLIESGTANNASVGGITVGPSTTLQQLDELSQAQRKNLSKICHAGEILVGELPKKRIRNLMCNF